MPAAVAAAPPAARQTAGPTPAPSADLTCAACTRSLGIADFPDPSASGVAAIAQGTGIDPNLVQFGAADRTCQVITPTAVVRIVTADAVP